MTTYEAAGLIEMDARYAGYCALCAGRIRVGNRIGYSRAAKLAFCVVCVDGGFAGSSRPRTDEIRALASSAATSAPADRRGAAYTDGNERALGCGPEER